MGRSFRGWSVGEEDLDQSEGENQRAEPAVSGSRASKRIVDGDVAVHVVGSPPLSDLLWALTWLNTKQCLARMSSQSHSLSGVSQTKRRLAHSKAPAPIGAGA